MKTYTIKGGNCRLFPLDHSIGNLLIQMNWRYLGVQADNIDASIFLLDKNGKVSSDADFIFYNQRVSTNGSVRHLGSSDTGLEQCKAGFFVDLNRLSDEVERLAVTITRHSDATEAVSLRGLERGIVEIMDGSNHALAHYDFSDDIADESAFIVGEIYRHTSGWKFRAIGQGFVGGLAALATYYGVCVEGDSQRKVTPLPEEASPLGVRLQSRRQRRSPSMILAEQTQHLKSGLETFLPQIHTACQNQENEARTRMILDRIFQDVFGYPIDHIRAEQNIEGRKADYVLSVDGRDVMVVEVKRAGMTIKERQIFQVTSYAAHSGIRWALLTNLLEWQLYRVSTGDRIEPNLVFSAHLGKDLDAETIYRLSLISFYGFQRQGLLEKLWLKRSTLSYERLVAAVLNQDVVSKIRIILSNESGVVLAQEEVQTAIERTLLHLD